MPMILTSYSVVKSLPPEGSEEWLALLPGWTGWKYHYGGGGDSNMVTTEQYADGSVSLKNIYYDNTHVVSPATTGVLSGICRPSNVVISYLGDFMVITPCGDALIDRLPKYYIKGNELKRSSGIVRWWAVAGVDSLTLE